MATPFAGTSEYSLSAAALALLADAGAKGFLMLLIAALSAAAMRRASAAGRHLVWLLGLVGLLVLPAIGLLVPRWQIPIFPPMTRRAPAPQFQATDFPVDLASALSPSPEISTPPQFSHSSPSPVDVSPAAVLGNSAAIHLPRLFWLLAAWAIVALAVLAPLLAGLAAVARLRRRAFPFPGRRIQILASESASLVGLRHPASLLLAPPGSMPMASGLLRPILFLPREAASWPDDKLRAVLLHELAHVRRRDCLTQSLAHLALALHWFNPLVWFALRRLRIERERACDDLVLCAGQRPSTYAAHLLEIARATQTPRMLSAAAITMAKQSHLEGRLLAVLDARRKRGSVPRMAATVEIAAALLVAVLVGVLQPVAAGGSERPDPEQIVREDEQVRSAVGDIQQITCMRSSSYAGRVADWLPWPRKEHSAIEYLVTGSKGSAEVGITLERKRGDWEFNVMVREGEVALTYNKVLMPGQNERKVEAGQGIQSTGVSLNSPLNATAQADSPLAQDARANSQNAFVSPFHFLPQNAPGTERYQRRTKMLARESLQESLNNLDRVAMYHEKSILRDMVVHRFGEVEKLSLSRIFSNRRFAKVQAELRTIPAKEAAASINSELAQAMRDYREELKASIDSLKKSPNADGPFGYSYIYDDDARIDLRGRQLKVMALLLLAAEFGQAGCKREVDEAAIGAIALRDATLTDDSISTAAVLYLTGSFGLSNPRTIATALLRTHRPDVTLDEAAKSFGLSVHDWPVDDLYPGSVTIIRDLTESQYARILEACLPGIVYHFDWKLGETRRSDYNDSYESLRRDSRIPRHLALIIQEGSSISLILAQEAELRFDEHKKLQSFTASRLTAAESPEKLDELIQSSIAAEAEAQSMNSRNGPEPTTAQAVVIDEAKGVIVHLRGSVLIVIAEDKTLREMRADKVDVVPLAAADATSAVLSSPGAINQSASD